MRMHRMLYACKRKKKYIWVLSLYASLVHYAVCTLLFIYRRSTEKDAFDEYEIGLTSLLWCWNIEMLFEKKCSDLGMCWHVCNFTCVRFISTVWSIMKIFFRTKKVQSFSPHPSSTSSFIKICSYRSHTITNIRD